MRRAIVQLMWQGLQHVLGWLTITGRTPNRLLFVSSSRVYGQQDGEWVDETSPAVATGYSGRVMLEAEQVALNSGIPASIVRLTGIYGPGREADSGSSGLSRRDRSAVVRQSHSLRRRRGVDGVLAGGGWARVALDDVYIGVDRRTGTTG